MQPTPCATRAHISKGLTLAEHQPSCGEIGCRGDCHQGRLPCPHDPAAVEAMREMGVDLRPLPGMRPMPPKRRSVFRWVAVALVVLAAAVFSAVFA